MSKKIARNAIAYNLRRITEGRYWITPDPRETPTQERYQVRRGERELVGWALIGLGVGGRFQVFECDICGVEMWDANAFEAHVEAHPNSGRPAPRSGYRRSSPLELRALDKPDPGLPNAQFYFKIYRDPVSGQ